MSRAAPPLSYYEFFAGGGLARLGLSPQWRCSFANDIDPAKAAAYRAAFGDDHFRLGDVYGLSPEDLPGRADLAWASSPCQDVSLAGNRRGLTAARSGAFFGFWRLIEGLDAEGRAPPLVVIENVAGLLTSNEGADFAVLCDQMVDLGYQVGALKIDARYWLPQSRPRLFVIGSRLEAPELSQPGPTAPFHDAALMRAYDNLSHQAKAAWVWRRLAAPDARDGDLAQVLEPDAAVSWFSAERTQAVLAEMSPRQAAQVAALRQAGERRVGAAYRRMRSEDGVRRPRIEARFDGLSGCLRTPAGGSSRQLLLVIDQGGVRIRRLTPREAARLMGAPEDYPLPKSETAALKLFGDAVAAPVVAALAAQLLTPLARQGKVSARAEKGLLFSAE